MEEFYSRLEEIIRKAAVSLYPGQTQGEKTGVKLEIPKNRQFGDIALNLPLKIASSLREPALKIAESLKLKIGSLLTEDNPGIDSVKVAPPGFVNFVLKKEKVKDLFGIYLRNPEHFFKSPRIPRKKILLEFVSANPTGPLSIAHGRQAVTGDVLASLHSFLGFEVDREYYLNDEGKQIDLFAESVSARIKELQNKEFSIPDNGYHGEYVKDVAKQILAQRTIPDAESLKQRCIELMIEGIKEDLNKIKVKFDCWMSQKELSSDKKIEEILEYLYSQNLVYEQEAALWFKSSKFGDSKDRVLKRGDNTFTYFAADIAYHNEKLKRGYNYLLNLWGPDHHGYIPRMKAAFKAISAKSTAVIPEFEIIIVQLVSLKEQKMSKRKGTAVLLEELVKQVGPDVARFYYLMRKNSSHLEFDIEKALEKNFDNPLYYIQYAYARICSIIRKHAEDADYGYIKYLGEDSEITLIKDILNFRNILYLAAEQNEPYYIISYLKDLASEFHKFYETNRVIIEDNPSLTKARIVLIEAVKVTLGLGLALLKIGAPSKM